MCRKCQTQSTFVVKFVRHFSTPTFWRIEASLRRTQYDTHPHSPKYLLIMRGLLCRFETAVAFVKIQGSGMLSRWRKISNALFEFSMFTL